MRKVTTFTLMLLLATNAAYAGPLRDAVNRAAQTSRPAKTATGENKLLWPGVALLGIGGAVALYGFAHTTGAEVATNTAGTSISVSEKHSTGVGFAGLAIAGLGGVLLVKGQHASPQKKITVSFNTVTIRF